MDTSIEAQPPLIESSKSLPEPQSPLLGRQPPPVELLPRVDVNPSTVSKDGMLII